ncbi:MAG: flagellar hook-associated protein FlgL, partial [Spirochaetota bacterium]|nr:flagellar hook-associated protein FlgL [Spirochaetota bacterium]
ESFKAEFGKVVNGGEPMITGIRYEGDNGIHYREVDRGEYLGVNLPGNNVFWGSNQRITSQTLATGYIATSKVPGSAHQAIKIDGVEIRIDDGDNLQTIVDKINGASIAVKAEIDNTTGNDFIVLQSTKPHQISLEDMRGGTVLQDLGLIAQGGAQGPNNYAPSAIIHGDSVFNQVIKLRNALLNDDINGVNRSIGAIDEGMDNLRNNMALVGARQKRMEVALERNSHNIVYAKDIYSKIQATDMAEAVTEMKNLELSHQAALQVGARILRPTLLDFLR